MGLRGGGDRGGVLPVILQQAEECVVSGAEGGGDGEEGGECLFPRPPPLLGPFVGDEGTHRVSPSSPICCLTTYCPPLSQASSLIC